MNLKFLLIQPLLIVLLCQCSIDKSYDDKSLSLEEYYKRGIMSINKKWEYKDYVKASEIILAMQKENKLSIPRKNSPASGLLFEKLMSEEAVNTIFEFTSKNSVTKSAAYYRNLLEAYVEKGENYQPYSYEVIPVMTLGLRLNKKLFIETNKMFLANNLYDNPDSKEQVESFNNGFVKMFLSSLTGLEDYSTVEESQIILFTDNIIAMLPEILVYLSKEHKEDFSNFLKNQAENNKIESVREKFSNFIKKNNL